MKAKLVVPNKLSQIKLWQYQKFLKLQEDNTDDKFLAMKLVEIFCEVDLQDVMKIKLKDVMRVANHLTNLLNDQPKLVQHFTMNNIDYGFIPNLEAISMGEFVDLDTYLSDWQQMQNAMCVLYRPVKSKYKDKYTIEEYNAEGQEKMKNMPMDAVLSSILFFYHLGSELSATMMNYLQKDQLSLTLQQQEILTQSGVGINQFTHSLREILHELNISLN
jgi:hypothetical protein|tara:strand:- start:190 stop:843 length:654 start_codon:yes stop_codon:yes gene_type:complete